ncbi:MAG: hypothetical protein LBM67_00325 [Lentimicrobiaceae bacterium]|nr:hypothetical protein [Lentimicrobiaceae bacterium]
MTKMKTALMLSFIVMALFCVKCTCEKKEQKISQEQIATTIAELKKQATPDQHERIEKAVSQVAALWFESDGNSADFHEFCLAYSTKNQADRKELFERLETNFEILWGGFNKMEVGLKIPLHVDEGKIIDIDRIFGGYSPGAHLSADFFENKLAFITILNFPFYTLTEKTNNGTNWSRLEWAYARMGDVYKSRIPAHVLQHYAQISSDADAYISDYNIYVGNLIDSEGKTYFPEDMKLISHWGLRDEIKSNYASKAGFIPQEMIYNVMLHIINQDIPLEVIDSDRYQWNPYTNELFLDGAKIAGKQEPNTRYQHLLNLFKANELIDDYSPNTPNYIERKFDEEMEIPVADVERIFTDLCSSQELIEVGKIISKRLGRDLQPWDIWYDGFKTRSTLNVEKIDALLKDKYPDKQVFEDDLSNILMQFGFAKEDALFIASKITVDPSRGAGHAWGAMMKEDNARLRTRITENGMDYKGYNIAIHEFGHNVEQTISLHNVDHYIMNGVPNTSFTEALAFVFQARDLELLGMENTNEMTRHLAVLDNLWSNMEIMGVSLVDIRVWKWLYAHPEASSEQLKNAVISIALDVWNTYFYPVFGVKDSPILAIYSHMIDAPLYLSAYPIGQLIEFQFGEYIKDKNFATEVYRAFTQGRLIPQLWMKGAVGTEISAQPLLDASRKAIEALQ